MWCVYHAALWIAFLTSPSFLWQQGRLHDIMKNRARKEKKKNDWILGGIMAILLVVFFKIIPFSTPIPFLSYRIFWSEKKCWWRQGKWQSLWGTSMTGYFSLCELFITYIFFNCILFILYVGGRSCYGTHVEVRVQLVELLLFFKDWSQAVSLADKAL